MWKGRDVTDASLTHIDLLHLPSDFDNVVFLGHTGFQRSDIFLDLLQAVGVGRDQFDALAEHSLHDRWCQANVVPLQEKGQVLEILETVA